MIRHPLGTKPTQTYPNHHQHTPDEGHTHFCCLATTHTTHGCHTAADYGHDGKTKQHQTGRKQPRSCGQVALTQPPTNPDHHQHTPDEGHTHFGCLAITHTTHGCHSRRLWPCRKDKTAPDTQKAAPIMRPGGTQPTPNHPKSPPAHTR